MGHDRALQAYRQAEDTYIARNPKSKAIFERAVKALPGGNTRSVLFYHPFPLSMVKAQGSRLYDVDGHDYVDLLGEYTAGLYGHSEPTIIEAIAQASQNGLNYGSQHEDEVRLASLIKERFPSIELLRFTNSGTEAALMALAVAKVYTSRKKILVFNGGYHGGVFSFKSGQSSPINAPHEYLIARYNDLQSVQALLKDPTNAADLAAIMVEPMIGSSGAIPATRSFLEGLRKVATECGALLIFDEVMTSRMHDGGGVQSQLPEEMRPDMTTLGKYIGGGMSFGAFGGKGKVIELFDPRRSKPLAHAGTFNNNVLTMAAGRAGLEKVFTPARARELHQRGDKLRHKLQEVSNGTKIKATGYGSILCFHFSTTPLAQINAPEALEDQDPVLAGLFHLFLLTQGFYIARRGFLALSLALSDRDLDRFVDVVRQFILEYKPLVVESELRARL